MEKNGVASSCGALVINKCKSIEQGKEKLDPWEGEGNTRAVHVVQHGVELHCIKLNQGHENIILKMMV